MSKFNYPYTIHRDGLVFEELLDGLVSDGTATDITWVASEIGYVKEAGSFNGSSSNIKSNNTTTDTTFTINTIINSNHLPTTTNWDTDYHSILNVNNSDATNYSYGFRTKGNKLDFFLSTNSGASVDNIISNKILLENTYYNVSCNFNYSTKEAKIYINSVLDNTKILDTTNWNLPNHIIQIGGRGDGKATFNGNIGLVRFYNKVLSEKEIRNLYIEGLRKLGPGIMQQYPELFKGCVAYYDFRNGSLTNLIDGVKATNNGATLTTDHLGNSDSAYSFDGNSNYIDTKWPAGNKHTYCIILKTTQDSIFYMGAQTTGTKSNKLRFNINNPGDIGIYISNSDATYMNANVGSSLYDGNYHIIFITIDLPNSTGDVFFDGVKQSTSFGDTTLKSYSDVNQSFYLGARNNQGTADNFFGGDISYFKVLKGVLSDNNIKTITTLLQKKYIYIFPNYTPPFLPKPILHINGNNDGGTTLYNQRGSNNATSSATITTNGLHQIISLSNQDITWADTGAIGTSLVWEKISGKFELQTNPAYITTTGIASTTKDLSEIFIFSEVLTDKQIEAYKYSNFIY